VREFPSLTPPPSPSFPPFVEDVVRATVFDHLGAILSSDAFEACFDSAPFTEPCWFLKPALMRLFIGQLIRRLPPNLVLAVGGDEGLETHRSLSSVTAEADDGFGTWRVTFRSQTSWNIRARPDVSSPSLATLPSGSVITAVEDTVVDGSCASLFIKLRHGTQRSKLPTHFVSFCCDQQGRNSWDCTSSNTLSELKDEPLLSWRCWERCNHSGYRLFGLVRAYRSSRLFLNVFVPISFVVGVCAHGKVLGWLRLEGDSRQRYSGGYAKMEAGGEGWARVTILPGQHLPVVVRVCYVHTLHFISRMLIQLPCIYIDVKSSMPLFFLRKRRLMSPFRVVTQKKRFLRSPTVATGSRPGHAHITSKY
jgi:hypothetical protein